MTEKEKPKTALIQGYFAIIVALITIIGGIATWYLQEHYKLVPKSKFSPYGTWSAGTKVGAEDCSLALIENDTFSVEIYEGEFKGTILMGTGYFVEKDPTRGYLVGAYYQTKKDPLIIFANIHISEDKQLTIAAQELDEEKLKNDKSDIGDDISKLRKYTTGFPIYTKGFFKYSIDNQPTRKSENDKK